MYNNFHPYLYNRSKSLLPYSQDMQKSPKNKFDFKSIKNNACTALIDVEYFLNNFSHTLKYIKLINLLK